MSARTFGLAIAFAASSLAGDLIAQTPAPPSEERCLEAYEKGQRLRKKSAFREARSELLLCARAPCPETFRPECLRWYDEVQALVPSIIVRIDGDVDRSAVHVLVDGNLVATRLDGTPIELDPGEHVVRVELPGEVPLEQKVLVIQSEKGRVVTFTAPIVHRLPAPPESEKRASVVPWLFVGVGTVALASFAYFGATGVSRWHQIDGCRQPCDPSDHDYVALHFRVADVSLGVAAVSFGLATVTFLTSRPAENKTVQVQAAASPKGGFLGLAGAF